MHVVKNLTQKGRVMQREIIEVNTEQDWLELRKIDITSTGASAMLGVSTYMTKLELWHEKKEDLPEGLFEFKSNDRMTWGNRLEAVIAEGVAEDHKLEIKPMKDYFRLPEYRLGSSFDFEIVHHPSLEFQGKRGILEIKNVDSLIFKDKWIVEDGEIIEAPPYIEVQAQHQLLVSGYDYLIIGVFIGGNKIMTLVRYPDKEIQDLILKESIAFWDSIVKNEPPAFDYEKDAEFIAKMFQAVQPGTVVNADQIPELQNLGVAYYQTAQEIKALEKQKDALKAQMLAAIGDNEKVISELFTISAGYVGPCQMNYLRSGYRTFKLTAKKGLKGA
jgi:putative phage-type endonuclease